MLMILFSRVDEVLEVYRNSPRSLSGAVLEVYRKLKICFCEAGFNMWKWLSNEAELLEETGWLESSSDPKKVDE